ncbi:GNAT family N-acetyltransferase [Streptomyces ipomoeae]|uniref:GNAT family N-acetyltransferase n=1 Tax=Streptomyces ipomoeae TaxID=103232 RepID=UPI001146F461|nr:GNAT family N-acetyltransferase [Streptomyces ipomoeae]MDX2933724.1 GNAT family N-acetyltransferase [Streptomyces ipomoeae]TQE25852.1 GNAT family N-acetyltransferase [Streptomyces ipomoeae]
MSRAVITPLDVPPPPAPTLDGDWALRPLVTEEPAVRAYAVTPSGGGTPVQLRLYRVQHHPLRACYPHGAHDIAVQLVPAEAAESPAAQLLNALVPALFTADPLCRRVVAAPAEDDTAAQAAFEAGGFRRVTEADLPTGTVVLFTTEPSWLADLPTALDDMPH